MYWPDGEPVTPWADPWHDVLADIRALMRRACDYPMLPAEAISASATFLCLLCDGDCLWTPEGWVCEDCGSLWRL